jgi:putative flippase GtrA
MKRQTRLWSRMGVAWARTPRFVRNVLVSLPTFVLDLGLMIVLVQYVGLDYRPATIASFFVTHIFSYALLRRLVFTGSDRAPMSGLVYFLAIAATGVLLITPLMWLLVSAFHIEYVVSRVVAGVIVGLGGYLVNRYGIFREGLKSVRPSLSRRRRTDRPPSD